MQSQVAVGAVPTQTPPFRHGAFPVQSLALQVSPSSLLQYPSGHEHVGSPPTTSLQVCEQPPLFTAHSNASSSQFVPV